MCVSFGSGDDIYTADADIAQIIEASSHEALYFPSHGDKYDGAFVGSHPLLYSIWSEQGVLVRDFQAGLGGSKSSLMTRSVFYRMSRWWYVVMVWDASITMS